MLYLCNSKALCSTYRTPLFTAWILYPNMKLVNTHSVNVYFIHFLILTCVFLWKITWLILIIQLSLGQIHLPHNKTFKEILMTHSIKGLLIKHFFLILMKITHRCFWQVSLKSDEKQKCCINSPFLKRICH